MGRSLFALVALAIGLAAMGSTTMLLLAEQLPTGSGVPSLAQLSPLSPLPTVEPVTTTAMVTVGATVAATVTATETATVTATVAITATATAPPTALPVALPPVTLATGNLADMIATGQLSLILVGALLLGLLLTIALILTRR